MSQLPMFDDLEPELIHEGKSNYAFQERLLQAMNAKGIRDAKVINDADVVRATGMPFSTFSQWSMGDVEYPIAGEDFQNVCRYLGVSADFILGMDENFSAK